MQFESEKFRVEEISKGVLINYIKKGIHIEKEDVVMLKEINKKLSSTKKYTVLVDAQEFTSISNEARKLSASKEYAQKTIAKALLIPTLGHKLVANFYIKVNKPVIKTRYPSQKVCLR